MKAAAQSRQLSALGRGGFGLAPAVFLTAGRFGAAGFALAPALSSALAGGFAAWTLPPAGAFFADLRG